MLYCYDFLKNAEQMIFAILCFLKIRHLSFLMRLCQCAVIAIFLTLVWFLGVLFLGLCAKNHKIFISFAFKFLFKKIKLLWLKMQFSSIFNRVKIWKKIKVLFCAVGGTLFAKCCWMINQSQWRTHFCCVWVVILVS